MIKNRKLNLQKINQKTIKLLRINLRLVIKLILVPILNNIASIHLIKKDSYKAK